MFSWTVYCSCVILHFSLVCGQAERIWENNLLDNYDVDLDGLGTEAWTEKNSTTSGTVAPTDNDHSSSQMDIYTVNNFTSSGVDVGTDNSTRSKADDNSTGSKMDIPTDNNVTRPETDVPTINNVTRSEVDIMTDPSTKKSRIGTSTTRFPDNTTKYPDIVPPHVCKNSSCPDLLILTTTVPEGANVTLQCGRASGTSPLWWYRDGTFLQQNFGEVDLHIVDAGQSHSGPYHCADERGCCILEHRVFVYGMPPYAYHLAVMGAVLAVGIPLCVFLSIRQSSKLGRYARMFDERHDETKYLI